MKRIGCMALAVLLAVSLSACGIYISDEEPAVLTFRGKERNDIFLTQTLTAEETEQAREALEDAAYHSVGGGCPFKDISITFGERVFGIASDGHTLVLDMERERYYELSDEGYAYIASLFEKYAGYFPHPY